MTKARVVRSPDRRQIGGDKREIVTKDAAMKMKKAKAARRRPAAKSRTVAAKSKTLTLVPSIIRVKDILVPTDFSEYSRKALRYAVSMAEQFGARLMLLHVVEPIAVPEFISPLVMENDKVMQAARAKLDWLRKQEAIDARLISRTLVRIGKPFQEIADAARSLKVDLIIVATHGYTGMKHALLGSTAERVVRHAPCPVLTVREGEREIV
jgi:nucleotide-binding universal stress UspA family protein